VSVSHPRGDTLILDVTVSDVPTGLTITAGRAVISGLYDSGEDSIVDNDILFTATAAETAGWAPGTYRLEVKAQLSDGRVSQVIATDFRVEYSSIGASV
jgi:hypothetical protein